MLFVPEELKQSGYTGAVVAEKLLDAARDIAFKTRKAARKKSWHKAASNINEMEIEAHMPDIQVPGTDFTLRSLLRYVRQIFSLESTYLRGEVTQSQKGFILTLRNISENIPAVQTPVNNDLNQLIQEYGGEALLKISSPQILAIHAYHRYKNKVEASEIYDESLQKLNEIINYCLEYAPTTDDALAVYLQGSAFYDIKRYKAAIEQYQKASKLNDKAAFPYISWGNVLNKLGRYEEAITKYKKSVVLDPKHANSYHNWGVMLRKLGRYKEANAMSKKADELRQAQSDNDGK